MREKCRTLVELVASRAESDPELLLYEQVSDSGNIERSLSSAELRGRALAMASRLQRIAASGERVLLFCHPTLETIIAFYATIHAGLVRGPLPPFGRGLE